MRTTLMIALGFFFLLGCTQNVMDGIMRSWEGAPIDAAIAQWGSPHGHYRGGGLDYYVWRSTSTVPLAPARSSTSADLLGHVSPSGNVLLLGSGTTTHQPARIFHGQCDRVLAVDSGHRVVRWQWAGNDCPFLEVSEFSHWRRR